MKLSTFLACVCLFLPCLTLAQTDTPVSELFHTRSGKYVDFNALVSKMGDLDFLEVTLQKKLRIPLLTSPELDELNFYRTVKKGDKIAIGIHVPGQSEPRLKIVTVGQERALTYEAEDAIQTIYSTMSTTNAVVSVDLIRTTSEIEHKIYSKAEALSNLRSFFSDIVKGDQKIIRTQIIKKTSIVLGTVAVLSMASQVTSAAELNRKAKPSFFDGDRRTSKDHSSLQKKEPKPFQSSRQ